MKKLIIIGEMVTATGALTLQFANFIRAVGAILEACFKAAGIQDRAKVGHPREGLGLGLCVHDVFSIVAIGLRRI
jgi:hypothetical protein